jgi:hypothetical protein
VCNKKDITREWRTLHNEELRNFFSTNIVAMPRPKRTRYMRNVAYMEEMRNAFQALIGIS